MPDLFTETAQRELGQRLARCLSGELAEEFLKTLLTLMSIVFVVNRDYRRNIKGFTGRYQFLSKDGQLTMAAVFREGGWRWSSGVSPTRTSPSPSATARP